MGFVIFPETNQMIRLPPRVAPIPTYARKRLEIFTLSRMLSTGVRMIKEMPEFSLPHISRYSSSPSLTFHAT